MNEQLNFVLVDDDAINNMLSEILIEDAFPNAKIISFLEPEEAIEYFVNYIPEENNRKTILFLDINMPLTTGWEFLERLDLRGVKKYDSLHIYMLSSSVNEEDLKKTELNKNITSFIEKPLNNKFLNQLSEIHSQ